MKNKFLLSLFLSLNILVYAQKEGVNYLEEETKSEQISKYRQVLLDKFIEKDMQAVKKITFTMIKDLADSNYIALYPGEYWLLMYWTQDYMELARTLEINAEDNSNSDIVRIYPQFDQLYDRVLMETRQNEENLIAQIKSAGLDAEIEEFILLNLKYFTFNSEEDYTYQEMLNSKADSFLVKYPESNYKYFIRNNIRYKIKPNPWFFEMGVFTGYGILSKDLEKRYTNPILFGVTVGAGYKRLSLVFRAVLGGHKTKQDLFYSTDTYAKGLSMSSEIIGGNLGYAIYENDWIKTTPFIGIAGMKFGVSTTKTDEVPELDEIKLNYATTFVTGMQVELYFGKKQEQYLNQGYSSIRLGYSYNLPQYDQMYGIKGDYHTITISYNLVFKSYKRDL